MKPTLALHKLPLYNTGRLDDNDIITAFSARQPMFERVIADLAEKPKSRAQHHLIVGQRGMGKTMLLARIAAEIRTGPMAEILIPLVFAEEQYAVDRLSKFWLNCLDSLADAQDHLGRGECAAKIDAIVAKLNGRLSGKIQDDGPLAQDALEALLDACASISRRPVLLVDNLQLVFERLSQEQQHVLREVLMRPGCPILVGASPSPPQESQDYGAAFYDHFKVHYLRPLEVGEMKSLMLHLAEISGLPEVRDRILNHPERLSTLRQLTGGNPRTTATLFFLYAEDFAPSVFGDLENLLDRMTPLYKARFEELSTQQQVIASAIANHWDPVTSRTLSEKTGLPMTGISPQLDRLEKTGFIERVQLFGKAANGFQIAERFFNVWFLMRNSRRQRREVEFLTRFIENFYEAEERPRLAELFLGERDLSPDRHMFAKALAATLEDEALAADLERHAQLDALRQKAHEARHLDDIIDFSSLPQATIAFDHIRQKLVSLVPHNAKTTPQAFADAVLSCRRMFIDGMRERITAGTPPIDLPVLEALMKATIALEEFDQKQFGLNATNWLKKRISTGQIRNPGDLDDWTRSFQIATTPQQFAILLDTAPGTLCSQLPVNVKDRIETNLKPKTKNSPEEWYIWSHILETRLGALRNAESALKTAIEIDPSSASAWNELGNLLGKCDDRWSDAEVAYRQAIELDSDFKMPWRNLGSLLADKLDRYEEAESAFQKAIALDDSYAIAWGELGRLYMNHLSRYEDAEEAYRKAIKVDPDFTLARRNLGILLKNRLSRYEEAEAVYRDTLEIDPSFVEARCDLCDLISHRFHRYEDAAEIYREGTKITPRSSVIWVKLGNLLLEKLDRFDEAAGAYRTAVQLNPIDTSKWNTLGNIYLDHLQLYNKAGEAFERVLELQPGSECALQNLIFLERDFLGKGSEARPLFDTSQNLHSEFLDTLSLQEALFSAYESNWGLASDALAKALDHIPDGFPPNTADDWMRASAVLLHLNYGQEFLDFLEARGDHIRLRPWYEALKALHLGDRGNLLNIAPEIRTTAESFYDQIDRRLQALPDSTRRRPVDKKPKKRRPHQPRNPKMPIPGDREFW